jgi:hypothetical protein
VKLEAITVVMIVREWMGGVSERFESPYKILSIPLR